MDLYMSHTSPYARMVRVVLREKEIDRQVSEHPVDPWASEPELVERNPLSRVPTLVTDEGIALTESQIIIAWLERAFPKRPVLREDASPSVASRAGIAMGTIDAAVYILNGRKIAGVDFDGSPIGQRRYAALDRAFDRLEKEPPTHPGEVMDLGAIATAVAIDYVRFRFGDRDWLGNRPKLKEWREGNVPRLSLAETMPREK